jgi:hypothetical protein
LRVAKDGGGGGTAAGTVVAVAGRNELLVPDEFPQALSDVADKRLEKKQLILRQPGIREPYRKYPVKYEMLMEIVYPLDTSYAANQNKNGLHPLT